MKNLQETQTVISPINLVGPQSGKFTCCVNKLAKLSIILQDETGRSMFQGTYPLEQGDNHITLPLPKLSTGNYNAWIEVLGETFIRPLEVEASQKAGIVGMFKQFLSLF